MQKVAFNSTDYQCCVENNHMEIQGMDPIDGEQCSSLIKPVSIAQQFMNTKKGKASFNENILYLVVKDEESPKPFTRKMVYDCNDGNVEINLNIDINALPQEDKTLLKSNEYCLKYSVEGNIGIQPTREQCLSFKLIKSSRDLKLICGYFEFQLKLEDGTVSNYNYCNIFDRDIYYYKKLSWMEHSYFDQIVFSEIEKSKKQVVDYTVRFTGDKDRTMIYFSSNNTAIYDGPNDIVPPTDEDENNGHKILDIGYLILLVLFLF